MGECSCGDSIECKGFGVTRTLFHPANAAEAVVGGCGRMGRDLHWRDGHAWHMVSKCDIPCCHPLTVPVDDLDAAVGFVPFH